MDRIERLVRSADHEHVANTDESQGVVFKPEMRLCAVNCLERCHGGLEIRREDAGVSLEYHEDVFLLLVKGENAASARLKHPASW